MKLLSRRRYTGRLNILTDPLDWCAFALSRKSFDAPYLDVFLKRQDPADAEKAEELLWVGGRDDSQFKAHFVTTSNEENQTSVFMGDL